MKTFLLLLFFSKTILLTPEPIDLTYKWVEISPPKSFSAITEGASIIIQVPVDDSRIRNIDKDIDIFNQLSRIFPPDTFEAILTDSKGNDIILSNRSFMISDFNLSREDSIWISLSTQSRLIPTKTDFVSVKVRSDSEIKNVKLLWRNFTH
jgi:hypothetical protein